ncbi:MAG: FkbM family methyltransferase [Bauldia sp.]|nr:FkbM family methyltransferase [Bauldia sp.]
MSKTDGQAKPRKRKESSVARTLRRAWTRARLALPGRTIAMRGGYPRLLRRPGDYNFDSSLGLRLEKRFVSTTLRHIEEPFVFLDIGANIGIYSLYADRLPRCIAVLAFEPVWDNFHFLTGNLRANRTTKVRPFCVAIGPSGVVGLRFIPHHSGMSHVTDPASANVVAPSGGADFIDAALQPFAGQRLVAKIDVEGAEIAVLDELARTSAFSQVSDLIVEFKAHEQNPGGFLDDLAARIASLGFEAVTRRSKDTHFRRARLLAPAVGASGGAAP